MRKLNLKLLNIQNIGLIKNQLIHFDPKFNVIIGETGSGKSLILEAFKLIIGQRADKKLLRKGSEFAVIEGIFESRDPGISQFFEKFGFPYDDEIIIKRIIYSNGKSKSFINHQSCSLQELKYFAHNFIDLVGQFENQRLLDPNYQTKLVDLYSQLDDKIDHYQSIYYQLKELNNKLLEMEGLRSELIEKIDYIDFQLEQLESINPSPEDEQELLRVKDQLKNVQENIVLFQRINYLFEGDNQKQSLFQTLAEIEKAVTEVNTQSFVHEHIIQAKELLSEAHFQLSKDSNQEFPQNEYEEVLERLNQYQKLKRKYNTDTEGLSSTYNAFKDEKKRYLTLESDISLVNQKIATFYQQCLDLAEELHLIREKSSKNLASKITSVLKSLRMEGATFKIGLTRLEKLNKHGFSGIEFLAETNPKEGIHSIKKIASGGELSRILLALRTVMATKDSISIFLFDEIDSGIGGETALCVGNAIQTVSASSQVITITHLPQIAKFADKIVYVEKDQTDEEGRSVTQIREFQGSERQEAILLMNPLN